MTEIMPPSENNLNLFYWMTPSAVLFCFRGRRIRTRDPRFWSGYGKILLVTILSAFARIFCVDDWKKSRFADILLMWLEIEAIVSI